MLPEAHVRRADDLRVGLTAEFTREITEQDILEFAKSSGDYNALHIDAEYARSTNYQGRIVHGAFQVGLASAMLGMHLPGARVLFGSMQARFPAPLYYPARVVVRGEIVSWNRETLGGNVRVIVLEASSLAPTAEIYMAFTLHEPRQEQPAAATPVAAVSADARPIVLVTGAAGGVGAAIVHDLAHDFLVIGATRRELPPELRAQPNVHELQTDVTIPGWESAAEAVLQGRVLSGIVHAAWPGAPRGGILETQDDVLEQQLAFGTTYLVRLARFLFANAAERASFVAIGSAAGTRKPLLSLGAYSLAKASLEHTVRLLAPELARRNITINAVSPAFIATGINKQSSERQRKLEAAQVPLGRLCTADDVAGMVRYLLSPAASFVSGQTIGLSGGQL